MARAITIGASTTYRSEAVNAYLRDIARAKYNPMTSEEEILAFADREKNREKIANANTRFVFSVAKCYAKGEDVLDYNSVGMIGLMTAIDKFDVSEGVKFISFAVHYIRMEMSNLCTQMSLVQRSNQHIIGSKVTKFQADFLQKNMREASDDEIIAHLAKEYGIDVKYRNEIHAISKSNLSDAVGEDSTIEESGEVAMLTASTNDYETEVEKEDSERNFNALMRVLTGTQQKVVTRLFVDGWEKEDVANELGLCEERVRQISKEAMLKIKNSNLCHKLYANFYKFAE